MLFIFQELVQKPNFFSSSGSHFFLSDFLSSRSWNRSHIFLRLQLPFFQSGSGSCFFSSGSSSKEPKTAGSSRLQLLSPAQIYCKTNEFMNYGVIYDKNCTYDFGVLYIQQINQQKLCGCVNYFRPPILECISTSRLKTE